MTLTIEVLDSEVMGVLNELAQQNRVRFLERPIPAAVNANKARRRALLNEIAASPPQYQGEFLDQVALIREDRDR